MIPILYGSQTGSAIHLAHKLAGKLGDDTPVLAMDAFDIGKIRELPFIIFICSTHGDGQCPFNMAKFWSAIMSDIPAVFSFKYAVLGLGDSSYQKYNWCAKMLSNRLKQLGAVHMLTELSNVQDKGGMYDGYYRFESKLIELVNNDEIGELRLASKLDCSFQGPVPPGPRERTASLDGYQMPPSLYSATVVENKLVSKVGYEKEIIEIIFNIPDYKGFYPGDCIGILPSNMPDALQELNFDDDQTAYILKHVDLNCVPRQTVFADLAKLTNNALYHNKLIELSQDYDQYHAYAVVPKRNIVEILKEFKIAPSYEFMMSLEQIYPRYYSCSAIGGNYSILVSLVDFSSYIKTKRGGLSSRYLKNLSGTIDVEMVSSRLFMESEKLLFFATGSGITLPRSAIHFFNDKIIKVYYGFRSYENDMLCRDEFKGVDLYPAASVDEGKYFMDAYRAAPVDNIDEWLVFASGNARINKEIRKLMRDVHGVDIAFQSETW